jgi:hypothetical protein
MSCSLFLADLLHFSPLSTEVLSFDICQIPGFRSDDNLLRVQPSNCCTFSYNVCWTSTPERPYLLVTGFQLCTVVAILLGVGHYLTVEYLKMVIDGAIPLWAGLGACSFFKC